MIRPQRLSGTQGQKNPSGPTPCGTSTILTVSPLASQSLRPGMEPSVTWMTWSSIRRSEEHTSELQSLMRSSYAVFCLKKKKQKILKQHTQYHQATSQYISSYNISNI